MQEPLLPHLRELALPNKIAFPSLFPKCKSSVSPIHLHLSGSTWRRITFVGVLNSVRMIRRIDSGSQNVEVGAIRLLPFHPSSLVLIPRPGDEKHQEVVFGKTSVAITERGLVFLESPEVKPGKPKEKPRSSISAELDGGNTSFKQVRSTAESNLGWMFSLFVVAFRRMPTDNPHLH